MFPSALEGFPYLPRAPLVWRKTRVVSEFPSPLLESEMKEKGKGKRKGKEKGWSRQTKGKIWEASKKVWSRLPRCRKEWFPCRT